MSKQWDVRANGMSQQRDAKPNSCQSNGMSKQWDAKARDVKGMGCHSKDVKAL